MSSQVHKFTRDGNRLYLNPNSKETVPSVTSITDAVPKPWLQYWGQKIVAQCAIDNIDGLPQLLKVNGRKGVEDFLKNAPRRSTADAAQMGSTAHALFEQLAVEGECTIEEEDEEKAGYLEGYADQFIDFMETVDPVFLHTEETVWSETHGYAGSFDAVVELHDLPSEILEQLGLSPRRKKPVTAMLDYKTSKSGVYPETALQVSGYMNADFIMHGDGKKSKIPKCDIGLVLNVRPDYWRLFPLAASPEIFDVFLALMQVKQWEKIKKGALGKQPLYESDTF